MAKNITFPAGDKNVKEESSDQNLNFVIPQLPHFLISKGFRGVLVQGPFYTEEANETHRGNLMDSNAITISSSGLGARLHFCGAILEMYLLLHKSQ